MDAHYILAHVLTVLLVIGVAGCAIAIPMAAWKFFAVLLERDTEDESSRKGHIQLD